MTDRNVVIDLQGIFKTYSVREQRVKTLLGYFNILSTSNKRKKIHALQNVNVKIREGETFGVIGRNGSGKSTLLNIIMGSIRPDSGSKVKTKGKIVRLALGMGVDKNLSARDNIYVNASILGLSFRKIGSIFHDIIEYAGLEEFVDTPVKLFSKGMKQRLLFSIAMHAEADIFLLDEFFGGVGDEDFKKKSDASFEKQIISGKTIVIVSHTMKVIEKYCTRVMWLHKGEVKAIGPPDEVIDVYQKSFSSKKNKSLTQDTKDYAQ